MQRTLYYFTSIMLVSLFLGSGWSCAEREAIQENPNKSDLVQSAKLDGLDALCYKYNLPPGCDLCDEFGWYYDGQCDQWLVSEKICQHADPDCHYYYTSDAGPGKYDNGFYWPSADAQIAQDIWNYYYGDLGSPINDLGYYYGDFYSPKKDSKPPQCIPQKATSNSGKICSKDKLECPAGEACLLTASNAEKGMCVGTCCPDLNDPDNPFNYCPVMDSTRQLSSCLWSIQAQQQFFCVWICQYKDSNGQIKSFDCPDNTNYDCAPLYSSDSTLKFCLPRQ